MECRRDDVGAGSKHPFHLLQGRFGAKVGVHGVDHCVNVVSLSNPNLVGCLDPQGPDPS